MTLVAVACVVACPARVVVAVEGGAGAVVRPSYCIHDHGAPGGRVHRADLLKRPDLGVDGAASPAGAGAEAALVAGTAPQGGDASRTPGAGRTIPSSGALVSVESLALAVCHEVLDALPRQFHHELPPDNHREDLPPVADRTVTEPAVTRWRDHAVHAWITRSVAAQGE